MESNKNNNAFVIVDVQNDFCPGGKLAVSEGDKIVPIINDLSSIFFKVIATQDWHPSNHVSFAKSHPGKNEFETIELEDNVQILWPEHCVQGTKGADFHPDLDLRPVDLIIRKGTNPNLDSYSAFFENDHKTATGLGYYLKGFGIKKVFLCGLATDVCVFYSAMDSAYLGFETYVIEDASRGVDVPEGNLKNSLDKMIQSGIKIIKSDEVKIYL
ncbi:MAG: bifunctional nicotinamidase/pyrazinamidase [Spirochaetes bacterium]|nr:MAG: bifunctional nicotinamidase/pyrazinamidase [Spirochaetota bacterium]